MAKQRKKRDPFAAREAKKYDQPIASRELILSTLEKQAKACSHSQLAALLQIPEGEQFDALGFRLRAMLRDGQLSQLKHGQYQPLDEKDLIRGRILAHKDGFGFLIPEDGGGDLYLHHKQMRKVFDGDIVDGVITHEKRSGKLEGEIRRVIERKTQSIVGKLIIEGEKRRVIPDNPKIQHTIFIDQDFGINAESEQIVVVDITQQPEARKAPSGIIREVLGNSLDPGLEIDVALRTFDIPHIWPDAVLSEAKKLADEPSEKDKLHRVDLRHLPLVTIDGEDARDFDDAVYCEKKKSGGWRLWVAIADVSHYVSMGSALNEEAHLRATSVYFPERVIPMLPEQISNGLCSLKPQVDRLCMVCEMTISANGRLSGYQFYEAVMHSHARLTYTEVGKMIAEQDDSESLIRHQQQHLLKPIDELNNLYRCLKSQREKRGAVEFDTVETRIIFDSHRKIDSIQPIVRNDAHKLIEECMLCANVSAARFLEKQGLEALYRVHDGPSEKKLNNLREFLTERGLSLSGGDKPTPTDYLALFAELDERDDSTLIQTMMLRSMSQAAYEPDNRGHFGLAYPAYAHFTSPIRRYPDLLVHRAIRSVIRSNQVDKNKNKHVRRIPGAKAMPINSIYPYDMAALLQLGEHCSMAERRADDATRDVMAWLKCEYLQDHLGDSFEGTINSVASFGFFVELKELYVEGLVHVSQLGNEFFVFDAAKQRLIGEHSRQVFHIGDTVNVQVAKVELDERKVHLSLSEQGHTSTSKRKKQDHSSGSNKKRTKSKSTTKQNEAKAKKKKLKSPSKSKLSNKKRKKVKSA